MGTDIIWILTVVTSPGAKTNSHENFPFTFSRKNPADDPPAHVGCLGFPHSACDVCVARSRKDRERAAARRMSEPQLREWLRRRVFIDVPPMRCGSQIVPPALFASKAPSFSHESGLIAGP
jgi:hypothetical protein